MNVDLTTRGAPMPHPRDKDAFAAWLEADNVRVLAKAEAVRQDPIRVVLRLENLEDEVAYLQKCLSRLEAARS